MPEGPIGFDREFATAILELKLEYSKDVPLGRDQEFTDLYIAKIKDIDFLNMRNTTIDVSTRQLSVEERTTGPLGMPIDKVGVLDIEIEQTDSITIDEIDKFTDTLSSEVLSTFETLSIDTNKLVRIHGDIIAKINGPLGGPRPFVNSDIVFEARYADSIVEVSVIPQEQKDVELKLEQKFEDTMEKRVDSFAMGDTITLNFRDSKVETSKLESIRAILRDIARDEGIALQEVLIKPDGDEF